MRLLWCPKNFPTKTFILQFIKVETLWLESLLKSRPSFYFFAEEKLLVKLIVIWQRKVGGGEKLYKKFFQFFLTCNWCVFEATTCGYLIWYAQTMWGCQPGLMLMLLRVQQMCSLHGVKMYNSDLRRGFPNFKCNQSRSHVKNVGSNYLVEMKGSNLMGARRQAPLSLAEGGLAAAISLQFFDIKNKGHTRCAKVVQLGAIFAKLSHDWSLFFLLKKRKKNSWEIRMDTLGRHLDTCRF